MQLLRLKWQIVCGDGVPNTQINTIAFNLWGVCQKKPFDFFSLNFSNSKSNQWKNKWPIIIFIISSWHPSNNFDNVLKKQAGGGAKKKNVRDVCRLQEKGGEKKVIYTSCWPWQSIGCDDHNLRVTAWYMATHSLIHLFHASIYPRPHLVSVFALNLFLDYLNQLPPCTCQTLSCPGSRVTLYLI